MELPLLQVLQEVCSLIRYEVGLGRATAVMLVNRGLRVMFADLTFHERFYPYDILSLVKNSENVLFAGINVSEPDSVDAAFQKTCDHFGAAPSLVVHCAGITASRAVRNVLSLHSSCLMKRTSFTPSHYLTMSWTLMRTAPLMCLVLLRSICGPSKRKVKED